MAEAVNLGTYHDLFFKLGGTDKTADEFAALTDQKEIDRIKEVYASWVAKYINVDEKNPPEEGLPNDVEAENKYFAKKEEEVANAPEGEKASKRQDLNKEYEKAGWKEIQVGLASPDGPMILKTYHYNPKDPAYEGMTQNELRAHFSEKLREEQDEGKPKDEREGDRQEPEPLNVSEGEEREEVPANEEENQDWKDDKEKFWKQHCAGYEQDCERDAEDTEGLTLNISKDDKKLGQVRYSDQKHASIAGADGKTADYSVFLGLVKDAKRNNQAINFSGEMSPEFAAKLKLACEELGVAYQNAPEGKIDANGFEDQLSEESKRKLAEYNAKFDRQEENTQEQPAGPKNYDEHLDQFKKDLADGKEIDLSAIADEKEKVIAYAAAMVAAKDAQKEDVAIKGAPEKTIGYKNEKVFEQDENGVIKRGEDGKPLMTENPLYAAAKDLPEEARAALEGHNQGVRQQQLEAARSRVAGTPERAKEAARRAEFRDNNHQYDENSNFNTRADREARAAVMKQYWENRRTNS
ncbi:MAG: hypothetical protein ACLUH4_06860 [Alphaproteobacteria bacterium]|jgi:hypothetical protein|uniref:hypothetical protein n=1 Tax=Candidatus Scatocola faecigallinarum TaxID=2840916 RepID=UPI000335966D|nr:unknown [Azospirillum sp. CAG:239]